MQQQANRARYARPNHIFFRHVGAESRDVYFRVNPQAIRIQQGGKSSVVDTLGGYFREVMYAEDPQHNGLMMPDLTIECETGAGYRKELQRLEWIWRNHGTPKADGTPADTYFMDMCDEDTLWFDGATGLDAAKEKGSLGAKLPQGTSLSSPAPLGVSQALLKQIISRKKDYRSTAAKTMGGSRYIPRAFKIAILNFSWDESVQDPYRIRFNFRCKVLRDMFWKLDKGIPAAGGPVIDLGTLGVGGIPAAQGTLSKGAIGSKNFVRSSDFPLNPGAAVSMLRQTMQFLPPSITGPVQPILNSVLQATGLGQNQALETVQAQGASSVYSPANGQRLYWRSEFSGGPQVQQTQQSITSLLQRLPASITAPLNATQLQVGGWVPGGVNIPSALTSALSLLNL
jgi:hypothetical protein